MVVTARTPCSRRLGAVVVTCSALAAGCSSSEAARKQDVDRLSSELRDTRERQVLMERRLADMDAKLGLLADKLARDAGGGPPRHAPQTESSMAPGSSGADGRPPLGVVRVGPRAGAHPRPAPEQEPAPVLIERNNGSAQQDDGALTLEVDRSVLADPSASASGAAAEEHVVARTDPRSLYALSMSQFKGGDFAQAARGFEEVADRWPDHALADNAVYWTGVCYLQMGEAALAINELQKVPVRFPRSAKVPDALFKLSEAYQRVGDVESAKAMLTQVVQLYPRSEAAGPAKQSLARLKSQ